MAEVLKVAHVVCILYTLRKGPNPDLLNESKSLVQDQELNIVFLGVYLHLLVADTVQHTQRVNFVSSLSRGNDLPHDALLASFGICAYAIWSAGLPECQHHAWLVGLVVRCYKSGTGRRKTDRHPWLATN